MTKEEFIEQYTKGDTEALEKFNVVLPCNCGEVGCHGWAVVPKDPSILAAHKEFYMDNS